MVSRIPSNNGFENLSPEEKIIVGDIQTLFSKDDCKYELMDYLKKYNEHYLVYYFLGYYYETIKDFLLAIACYRLCVNKRPFVDAYLNIAIIYQTFGDLVTAESYLQEAYAHNKTDLRILNSLGAIYYLRKNYKQAIGHYKKIIDNVTNDTDSTIKSIYNNIGFSYSAVGDYETALQLFTKGLSMNPHETDLDIQLLQNKLLCYDYIYDFPKETFPDYLSINSIMNTTIICKNKKYTHTKIRVGYVSPDLRQHVCAYFIDPILRLFDKNIFDVYCFANVVIEDVMSKKIKSYPSVNWINTSSFSTQNLYDTIVASEIDILIDLAGHTNNNNLKVFAKKPSPIQITYLGFPNTTGLTNMDYRITDKFADPLSTKQKYSEKLIRLPRCFLCYSPSIKMCDIPINYTKKTNEQIVFGVFNKIHKQNKHTFDVWINILRQCPNSTLLLKRDLQDDDIMEKFKSQNITNIKSISHVHNQQEFYNLFNSVDICLDTFPYSGTTTSCDTFLMGTPIVTLNIKNRHVSNVTSSFLENMGCSELIAHSMVEYVKIAVDLYNNPQRIYDYKYSIREKFMTLMNEEKFVKEFDQLLKNVYEHNI